MFESRGDFDNLNKWLDKVSTANPARALNDIAKEGGRALTSNTPRDTGGTSRGWEATITTKGAVSEVNWTNNAYPALSVNMALLIELGHGTGTGGYVPPRPFIKDAMDSVWKSAGDKIAKELVQ